VILPSKPLAAQHFAKPQAAFHSPRKFAPARRSPCGSEENREVFGMLHVGEGTWWGRNRLHCLLVLGGLFLAPPAPASAQTLVFRNDANISVVVQVTSVYRGVYRRDRPHLLRPSDTTAPGILLPGDKLVTITDARIPTHLLFQGALPAAAFDQYFRILADGPPPRVRVLPCPPPAP
jgi:hypothetical protein